MRPISEDDLVIALVQVLHEAVMRDERVRVPGLGTFQIRHEESRLHMPADGPARLEPPRDTVELVPDTSPSPAD